MRPDWIDEEAERRATGENRALTQGQHAEVNARYPGCTEEHCSQCGERTGRAGRGEDSIYCDECEAGPFCEQCWREHEHNPEASE